MLSSLTALLKKNQFFNISMVKKVLLITIILSALTAANFYDYLLFHCIIELCCIVITFTISVIAYNTFYISKGHRFIFIGIAYCFVCVFTLLHFLTYQNMGIFHENTDNISIYFFIISNYIESLSLLVLPLTRLKKELIIKRPFIVISFYSLLSLIFIFAAFYLKAFNLYFIFESKLTVLNKTNEGINAIILFITLTVIVTHKKMRQQEISFYLLTYLILKIISSLFFSSCESINSFYNIWGHIFRLISFYYIYKVLVETTLKKPINVLFNNLKASNKELENKASQLAKANTQLITENIERKHTEETLRQSEEHLKQLIEILPDSLVLRTEGKITLINASGLKMLGTTNYYDVVGKNVMDFVPVKFHEAIEKLNNEIAVTHCITPLNEEQIIRMDGAIVDIEVVRAPFFSNGEFSILVLARDITERKKSELLEKSIYEQNLQLNKAMEMDRMKTEFFANISHELRTPLNVIFACLQLLKTCPESEVFLYENNKLSKCFKTMNQNCYRLLRVINNLIDITKIDAGYMQPNLQNCNIIGIIEDTALSVAQYIESKEISLVFDTTAEELIIACDPVKIERIILNLLSNATKFTKPGGKIFVNIYDKENTVEISVKDTGIGLPEDKYEIIFERFRQVEQSLTRSYEGSGIGLALVKSLVEMHKGKITVESELGKGSNFVIELPVNRLDTAIINDYETINQSHTDMIKIEFSDICQR